MATTTRSVSIAAPVDRVFDAVAHVGGTIWDTLFTVASGPDGDTELKMAMTARPHTLLARITTPLIEGVVGKGVEADLASVKEFCEAWKSEHISSLVFGV